MSLTVEDYHPGHLTEWGVEVEGIDAIGYAVRRGGTLESLALVTWIETPLDPSLPAGWWAWFDSRGAVSPLAHRYALRIRDVLKAAGASYIHAFMDADIPRAEAWLRRLGFEPWRQDVWRLSLVVDCEGRRPDGFGECREETGQTAADHR